MLCDPAGELKSYNYVEFFFFPECLQDFFSGNSEMASLYVPLIAHPSLYNKLDLKKPWLLETQHPTQAPTTLFFCQGRKESAPVTRLNLLSLIGLSNVYTFTYLFITLWPHYVRLCGIVAHFIVSLRF